MSSISAPSAPSARIGRILQAIPIFGPLARSLTAGGTRKISLISYLMVIAVTLLVLAIQTWGIVALVMAALGLVPVMLGILLILARP